METFSLLKKICDQEAFLELKPKSKIPLANDWPNQGKSLDRVKSTDGNLGLILGIKSGILDIDLDCTESKALAGIILPAPHAIFERGSSDSSHYLYKALSFGPRKVFNADGKKSTLVELRGDGSQTMIPPSIHPNDSQLAFTSFNDERPKVKYHNLLRAVSMLAACSEVAQNWREGYRHDLAVAFSGLCLKQNVEPNLLIHIVQRICKITGDQEVEDRLNAIRTSCTKPTDNLLGYNGIVNCLGQSKAKLIADRIATFTGKDGSSDIVVIEPLEGELVNFGQFSDRSNVTEAKVGIAFGKWLKGKALYVVEKKQWMIWNGNHWETDQCSVITKLAYKFVTEVKAVLVNLSNYTDASNLSSFESLNRLENISKFAATDCSVSTSDFDTELHLMATTQQWIDLKSGQVLKPNSDSLVSKSLSVAYDPNANCPTFLDDSTF